MTAAALEPGDVPVLVLAAGGILVLVALARRARAGRPVLPPSPDPFRPLPGGALLSLALALFFLYGLVQSLVSGLGAAGDAGAVALGLLVFGAAAYLIDRAVLRPRGSFGRRVGAGLLLLWAALPLVWGTYLVGTRLWPAKQAAVEAMEQRAPGWPGLALMAAVIAPLAEEVAFRGLLYPALRQRLRPAGAIALTSVLFGLVHLPVEAALLPLAILGAFLAYLVEATGSVVPAVAAHMAFNVLTVATLLVF